MNGELLVEAVYRNGAEQVKELLEMMVGTQIHR